MAASRTASGDNGRKWGLLHQAGELERLDDCICGSAIRQFIATSGQRQRFPQGVNAGAEAYNKLIG
ncbi:hypothetical protein D3C84_645100 [compost metagenome]